MIRLRHTGLTQADDADRAVNVGGMGRTEQGQNPVAGRGNTDSALIFATPTRTQHHNGASSESVNSEVSDLGGPAAVSFGYV